MSDISSTTLSSGGMVLHEIIVKLDRKVRQFKEKLARFQASNTELRAKNARLKARIIELEHRLGKRPNLVKVSVHPAVAEWPGQTTFPADKWCTIRHVLRHGPVRV